jgi:CyaY protein
LPTDAVRPHPRSVARAPVDGAASWYGTMTAQNRGMSREMDDASFDSVARDELIELENAFANIDPDDIEVSTSDGVLRLDLRDGTRIVINSHRAARQIWMAAVASAWHFDPTGDGGWRAPKTGEELRPTLARVVHERIGLSLAL